MFSIEGLGKQLATFAEQRMKSQQLVHQLSGAMQVIENQIGSLKEAAVSEAANVAAAAALAAKSLAEQEAENLINHVLPGSGSAVVGAVENAFITTQTGEPTTTPEG